MHPRSMPASIVTLEHLAHTHARLIHDLGGAACVVPVPAALPIAAADIGALGALPCWSVAASPRELAPLARTLARRGHLGLLIATDRHTAVTSLAITLAPIAVTTCLTLTPAPLALQRLAAQRLDGLQPLEAAVRAAQALDVDAAGHRAFRMLHVVLQQMVAALPATIPVAERHAWALLQATRLLFLRFVEVEGWLDGRFDFLGTLMDEASRAGRDPARHLLHPLFFGTLNTPPARRSRLARAFGTIPFLNGGLFEAHPIERARQWPLPPAAWFQLIALLVDQIEVTLDADTMDGRVTPELLGRVFEGVMDPEARRDAGAFYTPPTLVRAIVREALACHLAPQLHRSESALADALDDPDPALQRALLDLRILDPAVGSGAFLVGALELLHGPAPRDARRVRHLVTRRLFGVDRHPGAVRLTELRLWLETLRAMRGRLPGAVTPLPNLDVSIRAGDSLLDPLHGHPLAPRAALGLAAERRAVVSSHGAEKRTALRALRRTERAALATALTERDAALQHALRDLEDGAATQSLWGETLPIAASVQRHRTHLRAMLRAVRSESRHLARDTSSAPFAIESAFAPVLAQRGGFDLVLANPPWVRAERLPQAMRSALGARYRWWRGSGRGFRHLPDLAVAFLERGVEALAPGGTLAYLVPVKLLTADYAQVARRAMADRLTLHRVADLTDDPRAGFDATTYPLALVASRRPPPSGHGVHRSLTATTPPIPQAEWITRDHWSLADPALQRLVRRLATRWPTVQTTHPPRLGVKTGANGAFLDPPPALASWTRPAIRGRDLGAAELAIKHRLLWPADSRGQPWSRLPAAVAAHLGPHRARLEARSDNIDHHWWRLFRTEAATAPHRVIWSDLARALAPTASLPPDAVPLNSCYVIATRDAASATALARWLGTTWLRALAQLAAEPAASGHHRFGARAVGGLPLPDDFVELGVEKPACAELWAADLLELTVAERELLRDVATNRR
jgi:hypothetical protein